MARPRLLIIAFDYPPSNTSGTLRTLKFTKYLGEYGWDSSVITVSPRHYQAVDRVLAAQVPPQVRVHRTPCFDAKAVFSIAGKYPTFVALPDRYTSWLLPGTLSAMRAIREEGISAVLSSSPVPTAHLIGLLLKTITGVPWVADFRDPWRTPHSSPARVVEPWLQRQVMHRADRIVTTTHELAEEIGLTYGTSVREKVCPIYNGYDEEDFRELRPAGPGPRSFSLTHTGTLAFRRPLAFLKAVRQCTDLGVLPGDMRVNFIGDDLAANRSLEQVTADLHLQQVVRIGEQVPYRQALSSMMDSSALLLLQGGQHTRTQIPSKAFEYLRTGRPILTLAPADSATTRVVREFPAIFLADPDDVAEISTRLAAMFDLWTRGIRLVDRSQNGLPRYTRCSATRELARVLDAATANGQSVTDG